MGDEREPPRRVVLLSYCSENSILAQALWAALNGAGFEMWIDRVNMEMDDWWRQVEDAMRKGGVGAVVVLLSEPSFKSVPVDREIRLARQLNIPVLQYDLDPTLGVLWQVAKQARAGDAQLPTWYLAPPDWIKPDDHIGVWEQGHRKLISSLQGQLAALDVPSVRPSACTIAGPGEHPQHIVVDSAGRPTVGASAPAAGAASQVVLGDRPIGSGSAAAVVLHDGELSNWSYRAGSWTKICTYRVRLPIADYRLLAAHVRAEGSVSALLEGPEHAAYRVHCDQAKAYPLPGRHPGPYRGAAFFWGKWQLINAAGAVDAAGEDPAADAAAQKWVRWSGEQRVAIDIDSVASPSGDFLALLWQGTHDQILHVLSADGTLSKEITLRNGTAGQAGQISWVRGAHEPQLAVSTDGAEATTTAIEVLSVGEEFRL